MKRFDDYLKNILLAQRVLKNAEGEGEGGGGTPPKADPPPVTPPKVDPPADPPKPKTPPVEDTDVKIKEAVETAKAEWEAEQQKKADEEKGEFENLYTDLKPKYEAIEKEVKQLRKIVDAEIKLREDKLSDDLKQLMPVTDDRAVKLEWLQKASGVKKVLGDPPNEPPDGADDARSDDEKLKEAMEARVATGVYS